MTGRTSKAAQPVTRRVVARSPLRHWGLERGDEGVIEIGDGAGGTVTQADFDGRLALGHIALVGTAASQEPDPDELPSQSETDILDQDEIFPESL